MLLLRPLTLVCISLLFSLVRLPRPFATSVAATDQRMSPVVISHASTTPLALPVTSMVESWLKVK